MKLECDKFYVLFILIFLVFIFDPDDYFHCPDMTLIYGSVYRPGDDDSGNHVVSSPPRLRNWNCNLSYVIPCNDLGLAASPLRASGHLDAHRNLSNLCGSSVYEIGPYVQIPPSSHRLCCSAFLLHHCRPASFCTLRIC